MAFKEWVGVCDALTEGRQSLILRKGGVSEGPGGFQPDHSAFWLYPTHVHQAEQGLRTVRPSRHPADASGSTVLIDALALVSWVERVESLAVLEQLAPFHDWTETTIRDRFHYRRPGLWALGVRVFRREVPVAVEVTPAQIGCKTWVPLEHPPGTEGLAPALDETEAQAQLERIRAALIRNPDPGDRSRA